MKTAKVNLKKAFHFLVKKNRKRPEKKCEKELTQFHVFASVCVLANRIMNTKGVIHQTVVLKKNLLIFYFLHPFMYLEIECAKKEGTLHSHNT